LKILNIIGIRCFYAYYRAIFYADSKKVIYLAHKTYPRSNVAHPENHIGPRQKKKVIQIQYFAAIKLKIFVCIYNSCIFWTFLTMLTHYSQKLPLNIAFRCIFIRYFASFSSIIKAFSSKKHIFYIRKFILKINLFDPTAPLFSRW